MTLSADDKLAIHELLARAAYAYDERDMDMLERCFTRSASMSIRITGGDLMGPFEGRDTIMGLFRTSMEAQTDVRRHDVTNVFFNESDGQIETISNLTLFATEAGKTALLTTGVYRDIVTRADDGWRIERRHLDLDGPY